MSAKRFIQLFICYAISMIVAILLTDLFNFSSPIAYLVVASIIGYVVITVPLTIMPAKRRAGGGAKTPSELLQL